MWLAHDGNDCYPRGCPYWLCNQLGQNIFLVVFGNGGDDGSQGGHVVDLVLFGEPGPQRVQIKVLLWTRRVLGSLVILYEGVGDICAASEEALVLRREVRAFLALRLRHRHRSRRHCVRLRIQRSPVGGSTVAGETGQGVRLFKTTLVDVGLNLWACDCLAMLVKELPLVSMEIC